MESKIRQYLCSLELNPKIRFYEYEVFEQLDLYKTINNVFLTSEQASAVHFAINNNVSCLVGGVGTGTTEVINAINWVYQSLTGASTIVAALNNETIECVKGAIGNLAKCTIAMLQSEIASEKIKLRTVTMLIIQESSMLGVQDLYLLSKMNLNDLKVLFVGDKNKLAGTGYGNFFKQAISYFPTSKLTKVYVDEFKGIAQAANFVLNGNRPKPSNTIKFIKADLDAIAEYAHEKNAMVICSLNETVDKLNAQIQKRKVRADLTLVTFFGKPIYSNDLFVFTKNNYQLKIFDGQFGTFTTKDSQGIHMKLDSGANAILSYEEFVSVAPKLRYAVNDLKYLSKGFDKIVVVNEDSPACNANWLYTAITLARKRVALAEFVSIEATLSKAEMPRVTQRLVPELSN
ncbi:ATP-dependent RecD-like DNA helicase [Paraglaciecola aquimarina]|uniref:ATP-dependent RecD-like DNA helicase n=1 Tax=Paraglaciecola aquimarina TaxID=1235557 RepID=A0ABU3T0L7_9ALTE|nr:ATP-dependent RecD-like DNA helicase [Paraglaciecola aquimarina]MDU0355757.1 ATP-dependent RecD-like DNA helicase [Paraglaciecola aquimarina]